MRAPLRTLSPLALAALVPAAWTAAPAAAQELLREVGFPEPVGSSLAVVPDLDGDGLPELVVGSEGATVGLIPGTGDVRVVPGAYLRNGTGPSVLQVQTATYNMCTPTPGLGHRVSGGYDLTGDGVGDYVASEMNNARLRIFDGATGVDLTANASAGQWIQMSCTNILGASLVLVEDLNGDGYADLVAGAPTTATPDNLAVFGKVRVYSGEWIHSTSIGATTQSPKRLHNLLGVNPNDRFGTAVCDLGDLDGDGLSDFAGSANEIWTAGGGYVQVFSGGSGAVLATLGPPAGSGNLKTGEYLASGDLDGDGLLDLVVASPGWKASPTDPIRGRLRAFSGASLAAGAPAVLLDMTQDLLDTANFGRSLCVVGDVNGDGHVDLAAAGGTLLDSFHAVFSGLDGAPLWVRWADDDEFVGIDQVVWEHAGERYLVTNRWRDSIGAVEVRRLFDAAGTVPCDGGFCPCGNLSDSGGCLNHTGQGALLAATGGSVSLTADDLRMTTTGLPPGEGCVMLVGDTQALGLFGNGTLCVALPFHRYPAALSTAAGTHERNGLLGFAGSNFAGLAVLPGTTLHFQTWYRDPAGPCGGASNFSNSYAITVEP